jgi:glucokinase
LAVLSIIHDRLASWNLCLHQYTIGHSSKQSLLTGRAANKKRIFYADVGAKMSEALRPLTLGIDLGGSKILTAVVNSQGKILASDENITPVTKCGEAIIQSILDSAHRVLKQANVAVSELCAIGIGAAGISNPEAGILFTSPNLPALRNILLGDIIQERLAKKTFLINDANAAALGEFYFGAARDANNFIYVTLSTGIGGGIVIDGRIYTGAIGAAGEVGHMTIDDNGPICNCGNKGCWETLASGTALAREAKRRIKEGVRTSILKYAEGDVEKVTAQVIHSAAEEGDSLAKELIAWSGYYVGVGLANLINIFNPELIVIGGGLSNIGDMLLEPAFKTAEERAYKEAFQAVRFASPELGGNSGVLGAAAFALQQMRGLPASKKGKHGLS